MNNGNYSNLGGMPLTQNRLDFMQQSYLAAFGAIAKLCGNKSILFGVEHTGGDVSDGWIVVDGELLPFAGGSYGTRVVIIETALSLAFADSSMHDVEFTRYATCGSLGGFAFSDLIPLLSLQNVWKKDDLRQCVKDATYEGANFNGDGYGITAAEKGWRIFSKVYTDAAGAVLVNKNAADATFDTVGNHGGEKAHTLTSGEQGSYTFKNKVDDIAGGTATVVAVLNVNGTDVANDGGSNQSSYGTPLTKKPNSDANPHNNLQPYFVVLTLIKL